MIEYIRKKAYHYRRNSGEIKKKGGYCGKAVYTAPQIVEKLNMSAEKSGILTVGLIGVVSPFGFAKCKKCD